MADSSRANEGRFRPQTGGRWRPSCAAVAPSRRHPARVMAAYGRVSPALPQQSTPSSAHERERDWLSAQSRGLSRSSRAARFPSRFLDHYERMGGTAGQKRSEEHTSELTSLMRISYAVFCLNKKK